MNGHQVTFFTQQDRQHAGLPVAEWLLQEARRLNFEGATILSAVEGIGHHHKIHSSRFFELSDQPVEVTMAVTDEQVAMLFQRLQEENLDVFYVKLPIEFGFTCPGQH